MKNVVSTLKEILAIHSPTGYTIEVINHIESLCNELNTGTKNSKLKITKTNKGSLLVSFTENPELVVTGHIDTLGAMVKEINKDGTLAITELGSYPLNSFEGEYVTVRNSKGKMLRGTFLLNNPADHVNKKIRTDKREMENMSVRLDALIYDDTGARKLGIEVGDFIFYDTRFETTDTGFVKSRFLDDKACAAVMIELIKEYSKTGKEKNVGFYFSNYEEVGHGSSIGIPSSTKELLVLDMAVVGFGCTGREDAVSICAKDSSGPYDFTVREKLCKLADKNKLNYVIDIYPYYGSDGSAALRSGYDVRVGLIGPGVSASHGVERTHEKGLEATYKLTKAYIENF